MIDEGNESSVKLDPVGSGETTHETSDILAATPIKCHTYASAGKIFNRSPRTIRSWVALGLLEAIRAGPRRLITEAAIMRFIAKYER